LVSTDKRCALNCIDHLNTLHKQGSEIKKNYEVEEIYAVEDATTHELVIERIIAGMIGSDKDRKL